MKPHLAALLASIAVAVLTDNLDAQTAIVDPEVAAASFYAQVTSEPLVDTGPHTTVTTTVPQTIPTSLSTVNPPPAPCDHPGKCGCRTGCEECASLWSMACEDPSTGGGLVYNPGLATLTQTHVAPVTGLFSQGTGCATGDCPTAGCVDLGCADQGCESGGCIGACRGGCCGGSCGAWAHFTSITAEFLYLRVRNAEIAYGVPIDGPITAPPANNPIQVGRIATVDSDYEPGFSAAINFALNPLSSLNFRYTGVDFETSDSVSTIPPDVIRSIVAHPSSQSTQTDFLSASAGLGIDYSTIDLTLRHLFVGGDVFAVNYFLGTRYGQLDQYFQSVFVDNETEFVIFRYRLRRCGHSARIRSRTSLVPKPVAILRQGCCELFGWSFSRFLLPGH